MGCLPYGTSEEIKEILETSGILDSGYTPTKQEIDILENAIERYGKEEISRFLEANGQYGEYVFQELAALVYTSDILGSEALLKDMTRGLSKFKGAVFELAFAAVHHDDILAVEEPTFHVAKSDLHEYTRSGADFFMKDGSVFELKSYNFNANTYRSNARQRAENVANQAFRRLEEGASEVTIVFNERLGKMPDAFKNALDSAIGGNPHINYISE